MKELKKSNGYWTYERVANEAKKYGSRSAFKKGSVSAYGKAVRKGWADDFCSHMKVVRKPSP